MLKAVVGTENPANESQTKMWASEFSFRTSENYTHLSNRTSLKTSYCPTLTRRIILLYEVSSFALRLIHCSYILQENNVYDWICVPWFKIICQKTAIRGNYDATLFVYTVIFEK